MEVKESERTVIAKPVASRPCGPSFRSFTDLLNDDSSHSVPVIRPKTVSFKPTVNRATISTGGLTSSQAEILSDKVDSKSDGKPAATTATNTTTVVYKPLAKLVSKTTVSLLASMANFNNKSTPNKQTQAPPPPPRIAESMAREASKGHNCKSTRQDLDNDDDDNDNNTTNTNNDKSVAASDARALSSSSYDGYNWRKYGQKQVKGSEYPRSYYKCTHPGCPVKKKVERSLDGQIAEIVYKAEHNHSKPQPANNYNKRTTTGSAANSLPERTSADQACSEGNDRVSEIGLARICSYNYRGVVDDKNNNEIGRCRDNSVVVVEAAEEQGLMMTSKGINIEADDDQEDYDQARSSKRRKGENNQLSSIAEAEAQECRVVVQNLSDPEVSGDGFRWRKYGQKVVKGNPYPRSYYRCTSLKCNMRKHVERASDDPKAFITTYEGKHNHEMPIKNPNNNNNINNNSHTD